MVALTIRDNHFRRFWANPHHFNGGIQPSNYKHSDLYLGKITFYSIMPKVNRYRIYPTKSQVTKLNETLELCRWIYNETLALRKKCLGI